jgi:histidine ammonia-lyase
VATKDIIKISIGNRLTLEDIRRYAICGAAVTYEDESAIRTKFTRNHDFFKALVEAGRPIYGATTGFGSSSANRLSKDDGDQLQCNLMRYHGCGVGPYLSEAECAATLLIRINCLAQVRSGVGFELLDKLMELARQRIFPAIPARGSVGASGDLTPLSYIAAAICAERTVYYKGSLMPAKDALTAAAITPYRLKGRDALALMNGTSVMSAVSSLAWHEAKAVADTSAMMTALLVELMQGRTSPYATRLHEHKPHAGQLLAAHNIAAYLNHMDHRMLQRTPAGGVIYNNDESVQDKYSLRCAPQVIGVLYDTLEFSRGLIETEVNSVNDNPLFIDEEELVLNGGNFYGGHIGAASEALKVALANVVNLMDRQMALLMGPDTRCFLGENLVLGTSLGDRRHLHHGFKAMQITLSALCAEILKDAAPAVIFSRPTECGNQDVVSMGTIAARGLFKMAQDAQTSAAILMMAICQSIHHIREQGFELPLSTKAERMVYNAQGIFPKVTEDRAMDQEISGMTEFLFKPQSGGHDYV